MEANLNFQTDDRQMPQLQINVGGYVDKLHIKLTDVTNFEI